MSTSPMRYLHWQSCLIATCVLPISVQCASQLEATLELDFQQMTDAQRHAQSPIARRPQGL